MNPLTPERLAEIEKYCRDYTQLNKTFPVDYAAFDIPDLLNEIKRLNGELNSNLREYIVYENDPFYKFHPDYGWLAKDTCESITEDVDQLNSEIKRLREELAGCRHEEEQWDLALSEYSEYEGDEAPWNTMRNEFNQLRAQLDKSEKMMDSLQQEFDKQRAQLSDAQAALKVKDEALVRLSEQRGTLLGVATTFKQTVFLGGDRPLKQEQRERLLQNLAEIIKDCSDNTATAAPQPGRE
jgi:DNA repair exonuclease SbcCD ATPase subunit